MTEKDVSAENVFLKAVFSARDWETYFLRTKILSSPDPENWNSIDFPAEIALELTNYCNLRCVMCPVPKLKRQRGFMDNAIFNKIVEDISEESGFLFLPQGFGESLLHARWVQLIALARTLKIRPIAVLTNGMLLSEENITALINRVDILVVTIDGSTAKTYESIRVNGSFEKVTGNIENFLKMRGNSENPHLVLRIIRMEDTEKEIGKFQKFWAEKVSGKDLIQISDCIDWAGSVPHRGVDKTQSCRKRNPCRMLWKNLTVYHNGQVSPCCYDAEGELIIGNVLHQSSREIWNGSLLRNLRNLHLTGQFNKIPICSRCRNWH